MSLTQLPGAIVVLLLAATVTPGPNNLLMLRIGLEHGLRAVLAPATGVVLGGVAMLLLSRAGLARAFAAHPWLRAATAICGAGCVMWLGVRLTCGSGTASHAPVRSATGSARQLLRMFLFQFLNPKSWLLVLTITAAAGAASVSLTTLIVLFVVIPYGCLALWAGGGSLAADLLRDTSARVRFERSTGALLALSGLLLLW
ncbi:MAG TPA: LysE family transporter [Steroidobacteraceae bacterium]|nr:LysE family transporter [Steroidobacteraceae bacterium]